MCNALRLMALTIIVALANSAAAQTQPFNIAAQLFTVTDLGPNVIPEAINDRGQVTGGANCPTCGPNQQAFLWSPSTGLIDIGGSVNDFLGGSDAFGLNNLGEVVGTSNAPFAPIECCDAYIWSAAGKIQNLGTPPDCTAIGVGINDRNEVVGSTGQYYYGGTAPCSPFFWEPKKGMQEMGLPPGALTAGVGGINREGMVVGAYEASDSTPRSYTWTTRDGYRDLGFESVATAINNKDHIVGQFYSCPSCNPNTNGHAFLSDRQHGPRDLGVLPGQTNSYAQAVNFRDQVVGYSALFYTGPYPFLWTKTTGMLNLNTLIETSSGWVLYDAAGINDKGQIIGWGILNGEQHGFVLTPKDCF